MIIVIIMTITNGDQGMYAVFYTFSTSSKTDLQILYVQEVLSIS